MKNQIVFGLHAIQSLLDTAPERVLELLVLQGRQDQRMQSILAVAEMHGIAVSEKPRKTLDNMADGNHQGVVALAKPMKALTEEDLYAMVGDRSKNTPFLLILDGVTDPHNLGACIRSADAAGVQAVIVPKDNSVGLTEVVRKVACGAADTVPLISVTNLARTLQKLQESGVWIVGTAGEVEMNIYQAPLTGPLAIVMGAEGKGMRRLTREHCDHLAYIPMAGSVSSLNVSVAAGICMFEAVRQRQLNA
jgi:23S rRNA (guanosine2251-2'-O)-methyltransferase